MKSQWFFVDAESDGLYGKIISIAVIVTDSEGNELERYYWGISKDKLTVETEWVKENVIPIMGEYEECQDEEELLNQFWMVWENHYKNAYAIADVSYPVESSMFEKCVKLDENNRKEKAPFPLLDLSSFLLAKGIDPLISRIELAKIKEKKQHNALVDVELSIKIWREYIK